MHVRVPSKSVLAKSVLAKSVLALAVAACSGYAHADTFIETRSQPGDWIGAAYDASKLHLNDVGTFDLRFSGADNATFNYNVEGNTGSIPLTRIPF